MEKEIPKVYDDPELQEAFEKMRKSADKAGIIGKSIFVED